MATRHLMMRRLTQAGLALALGLAAPGLAAAGEACTNDVITLVVPYAPGGVVDLVGRVVADDMRQGTGQNVIVENKPGAGSNIGTNHVAHSTPDGRTLILASAAHTINPSLYSKQSFDAIKDFKPVAMVGFVPNLIVVNNEVPVNSMAELIAYAKANPGKLAFGSAGSGSSPHLAGEMLKSKTGIDILHIPYQGQPAAVQDLIANRIQMMALTMTLAAPLVKDGKLKALAITSEKRSPTMPDLPTVAESAVPGFNVVTYLGVLAPAGTPDKVVACLNKAIVGGLDKPEVVARLKPLSVIIQPASSDEFAAFLVKDKDRWAEVIKAAGIKVN